MSVKAFKFVSPGIFVNEIDNSALPETPAVIGPLVIGRTLRGPGMRPIKVNSFEEFIEIFGPPVAGGKVKDGWRESDQVSAMYAPYAAQAYLRNSAPITVVRLLGEQASDAETATGLAGWKMTNDPGGTLAANGGAYGLFIINSSSAQNDETGSLAAVFYLNSGSAVLLSGTVAGGAATTASTRCLVNSVSDYHAFDMVITSSTGVDEKLRFNFNENSPNYIRSVFNTDPTAMNSAVSTATNATAQYFLGETYTRFTLYGDGGNSVFAGLGAGSTTAGTSFGCILPLEASSSAGTYSDVQWHDHQIPAQAAQTGWIFSQDKGTATSYDPLNTVQNLFKIHSLKAGAWDNKNVKISIEEIRAPLNTTVDEFATFTVVVRKLSDTDARLLVMEKFSNCNLNPASPNYVARKIGDKYYQFDAIERRIKEYGQYDNQSRYIRVEMDLSVDAVGAPTTVPFGFFGPPQFKGWTYVSGAGAAKPLGVPNGTADSGTMGGRLTENIYGQPSTHVMIYHNLDLVSSAEFTGSFVFPTISTRLSSSDEGLPLNAEAYFGFQTTRTAGSLVFNKDIVDSLNSLPDSDFYSQTFTAASSLNNLLEVPVIFSLDNVVSASTSTSTTQPACFYLSGSRQGANSITAGSYTKGNTTKSGYEAALLYGVDSFTIPLFGGVDGFDITEKDPFRNSQWTEGSTNQTNSYAFNSVKQAIDTVRDAELVDMNIVEAPGITLPTLTDHLITTAEERADTLAIIDIENDYKSKYENTQSFADRVGDVDDAVSSVKNRNLDSSYGCAYYPWVQIYDTINNQYVWVPPSVAAIGTMSNSQARSELWFAPAGFNRGGLTAGGAGIPVTAITQKLTSKDRDSLYDANVNPIASFPAEGIVVFGQKTLQATKSALDRINVRRLLIFLKKQVSLLSTQVLFDQNIEVTWNRFIGLVDPFLQSVKTRYGLEDYKLVLDKTTTTPDLVDRNILYAKIYLKPAKSIEFIAIDFNISRSGAAFED